MTADMEHELEIQIGPFQEWEGKQGKVELKIVSNGDIGTMKVKVHIEKVVAGVPNLGRISIWNLKRSTIDALNEGGKQIRVYAGTRNATKELLYTGSLQGVITQRAGTDYVTTLICRTAESNLARSIVTKTWTEGVPLDTVVREIVSTIPNVIYDPNNKEIKGQIGYKGFSFMGSANDALNKLGNQFGFSWNIDNGVFSAIMDGHPRDAGIRLDSKSGLRNVSPRLSGIKQIQTGVDIFCIYRQSIKPNQLIRVESDVNPKYSGNYDVHAVEYDLCPKDDNWDMRISTFVYQKANQ